jgi:hypothetical protein
MPGIRDARILILSVHGVEQAELNGDLLQDDPDRREECRRPMDELVVVDQGIITSRSRADLPVFVAKIVQAIEEGRHTRRSSA